MIFAHQYLIWMNLNHMTYPYHMIQLSRMNMTLIIFILRIIADHETYRPYSLNLIAGACQFSSISCGRINLYFSV